MPEIEQIFRVAFACKKPALQRFMRHMIADGPVELGRRPKIELQLAEFLIPLRPVDGVILIRPIVDGKTPCQRLLIKRIGVGQRVQFAGLGSGFSPNDMLDRAELQELAGFRRIDDERCLDCPDIISLPIAQRDAGNPVSIHIDIDERVTLQNGDQAGAFKGSKQVVDHPHGDLGLMTQRPDISHTRIERPSCSRIGGQRIMSQIIFADRLAKHRVASRPHPGFHPWMFVKRDTLRGQLASKPIQLLRKDNADAQSRSRQGRGDPSESAANDEQFNRTRAHVLILSRGTTTPRAS